jgi:signal recognition particle subunit SRP72
MMVYSVSDPETMKLASHNLFVLRSEGNNPFSTQRDVDATLTSKEKESWFKFQRTLLQRNKHVADLLANKFSGWDARISRVLQDKPAPVTSPELNNLSALRAAAHCHGKTGNAALKDVIGMVAKQPSDVGLLLTATQLYLDKSNAAAATSLLEAFFRTQQEAATESAMDARFSSGLVALAVALYRVQGRESSVKSELANALAYWRKRGSEKLQEAALLREAGIELLRSPNPKDLAIAGAGFEALCAGDVADPLGAAGLVASFATTRPEKAEKFVEDLPSVESLISGVDTEALIEGGIVLSQEAALPARKRAAEEENAEKPKKKRKRKLPANYEEGKTLDQERWLPLRDRSSYRPKGKKGKKKANETTQGGVVKEEETLELVGGAGAVKVEKASSQASKKKKKGKR